MISEEILEKVVAVAEGEPTLYALKVPYHPAFQADLKALKIGAKFEPVSKHWYVPAKEENRTKIVALLEKHGFTDGDLADIHSRGRVQRTSPPVATARPSRKVMSRHEIHLGLQDGIGIMIDTIDLDLARVQEGNYVPVGKPKDDILKELRTQRGFYQLLKGNESKAAALAVFEV